MQSAGTTDSGQANRDSLVALYEAFAQGDMEAAAARLTDDIEWHVNGPAPVAGVYRGRNAVLAFMRRMMAQYDWTLRVEVTATVADEHQGFVRGTEHADRPHGGATYTGVHLWDFRDGRCARFESHYDDAYTAFWSRRS